MDIPVINKFPKGGVLLEVMITAIIVGIVTLSLFGLYNYSRDTFIESQGSIIAVNALDTVMAYFENYYTSTTNPGIDPKGGSVPGNFYTFFSNEPASPANLPNDFPEKANFETVLNQLKNCNLQYKIDPHTGSGNIFKDRMVTLRITWEGGKDVNNSPVIKQEEMVSVFTSGRWLMT